MLNESATLYFGVGTDKFLHLSPGIRSRDGLSFCLSTVPTDDRDHCPCCHDLEVFLTTAEVEKINSFSREGMVLLGTEGNRRRPGSCFANGGWLSIMVKEGNGDASFIYRTNPPERYKTVATITKEEWQTLCSLPLQKRCVTTGGKGCYSVHTIPDEDPMPEGAVTLEEHLDQMFPLS
jgi:hypothetical protein